jgi:hypothetical protein
MRICTSLAPAALLGIRVRELSRDLDQGWDWDLNWDVYWDQDRDLYREQDRDLGRNRYVDPDQACIGIKIGI